MSKEHKIIIILSCIAVALGTYLYITIKNNKMLEAIYKQNQLAHDTAMKILQDGDEILYQKYAFIQSNLSDSSKALKKKDEKILSLTQDNIHLKDIISSTQGHIIVIGKDSSGCMPYGSKIEFRDSTEFYKNKDTVLISSKPIMKRHTYFLPFGQSIYLTRNTDGQWSGYEKFMPDFINKYLTVSDLQVFVDRDEFVRVESDITKFRLKLIPGLGLLQTNTDLIGWNIGALINNKHFLQFGHGIGNSWFFANYGYAFDVIK